MLTFVTMYVIRLYYPRWKEFFSFYLDSSRRNNYGRWAMRQSWKGEKSSTPSAIAEKTFVFHNKGFRSAKAFIINAGLRAEPCKFNISC